VEIVVTSVPCPSVFSQPVGERKDSPAAG
jgi:hypothetical protein